MIRSSRSRATKRSAEQRHADTVRRYVLEERDAACRVACLGVGPCSEGAEWAHVGSKRRCFTRGMEPAERHDAAWTLRLCTRHHRAYDAHEFEVFYLEPDKGANGRIMVGVGK